MHNRFDQLAKQIGREALGPSGPTVVHDEVSPETQYADLRHEPDPARTAERKRLGPRPFVDPFLWIIAAGAPTNLLAKLKLEAAPGWPAGVYFLRR